MKPLVIRRIWDVFCRRFPKVAVELNYLRRYHNYEPDIWLIPRFCGRDAGAIDVGVNMGIFSRWMAKYARRVDGFECNPFLFAHLESFLPRNVTLHRTALSSHSGTAHLRFDPENTGIGTIEVANRLDRNPGIRTVDAVPVEVRRLDDFALAPVTFMKIDVEGHELNVLEGAAGLIARDRPTLLIEIEERHCPGNLQAIPRWLGRWGYVPQRLVGGRLAPVAGLEEAAAGCNNFWFIAP